MDLKSLVKSEKIIEAEFPGIEDFKVKISYLSRDEMLKIRNKSKRSVINKKTRQFEEDLDEDLFLQVYIKSVIKGWSGLKFSHLSELIPLDETGGDPEELVPYTEDNAYTLMTNSTIFDQWVSEVVSDVTNFNKDS